jgi:hypothetical protein
MRSTLTLGITGVCALLLVWHSYAFTRARRAVRAGVRADGTPAEHATMDIQRASVLGSIGGFLLALAIPIPSLLSLYRPSDGAHITFMVIDFLLLLAAICLAIPQHRLVSRARKVLAP